MTDSAAAWTVVVPVKGTADGKSRMSPAIDEAGRRLLVEAFARDALAAVAASPYVERMIVVTDAAAPVASLLRSLGAEIVADPGGGLNAAIAAGVDRVRTPVAVLLGDLPTLTTADLDDALALAAEHPLAFVTDADRTGTTLLTARDPADLVPRFGTGSAGRHQAAGHTLLGIGALSSLRHDVDTEADLIEATQRGLGPHTAEAVRGLSPRAESAPSPRR